MIMRTAILGLACTALAGCSGLENVGRAPAFTPVEGSFQHHAMYSVPFPEHTEQALPVRQASLWSAGQKSLLGDRRAARRGDILTVVIEIDERAEISNSTDRSRTGTTSMGLPQFFGIPQRIDRDLPEGASMAEAVSGTSASDFSGDGSVRRNERLTLRIASTVVESLPNGVLRVEGTQEVRVNNELRELIVTGYVRPEDISRRNEITYDKIAGARISYGGRGQISDMQQPRWGQQISDVVLPF
jgi:flagellar L-ring protein precursor FlgH